MCKLVRHHERKAATLLRRCIGAEQEKLIAEGHQARVLHRARSEIRHRNDVELVEGIGNAEPSLERRNDARRVLHRVGHLGPASAGRDTSKGERR